MEKRKIGDTITVLNPIPKNAKWLAESMKPLKGKLFTIKGYETSNGITGYKVKENGWSWTESMLEPINSNIEDVYPIF